MSKLAFLLASIKSSALTRTTTTHAPYTNLNLRACLILEELGYIRGYTVLKSNKIKIYLNFYRNKSVIRGIRLFSKPASRMYISYRNLRGKGLNTYLSNYSFIILSTSYKKQLLTDVEAFLLSVGGEPLFVVS